MRRRRSCQFTALAATVVLCAGAVIGTVVAADAAPTAAGAPAIRLHLPAVSAGRKTVHFGGVVAVAAPRGWIRTALPPGSNPSSEADFRISVAAGCTALAFVSPQTTATTATARAQLRRALPAASQAGTPVPPPVRVVETGVRAHSGAWEVVAPPAPPDSASSPVGGYFFSYYGAMLLKVAPARWAGLAVGLTARPSACAPLVLHDRAVKVALTRLLRAATLQAAAASG
jgi:hypothetical protein